jgi:hypothetical protein
MDHPLKMTWRGRLSRSAIFLALCLYVSTARAAGPLWTGRYPTPITNGLMAPAEIIVCSGDELKMPTNVVAPVYSPTNFFTRCVTNGVTGTVATNTVNVTYSVGEVFWTNITTFPYTNFPDEVTNQFSADAVVAVASSAPEVCPSPGLVKIGTVTWYAVELVFGVTNSDEADPTDVNNDDEPHPLFAITPPDQLLKAPEIVIGQLDTNTHNAETVFTNFLPGIPVFSLPTNQYAYVCTDQGHRL